MTTERRLVRQRRGRVAFALLTGVAVVLFSYRWITDPVPRAERVMEENVVSVARQLLIGKTGIAVPEIVDPLAPNRKVGKVYIYREGAQWAVSGFYRRDRDDSWHPYLMLLSDDLELVHLKVRDKALSERAATDPVFEVRY